MAAERDMLVSPRAEVPVIEGALVTAIRSLAGRGVGSKGIARQLGVARNTVRRYLRQAVEAGVQVRPQARRLSDDACRLARGWYEGPAAGNAVVVQRLLSEHGTTVSLRTVERAVADLRRARQVAELATVRVESPPGDQLQVDFGQKRVRIAGAWVRVFLLVAVLSYSRRLFVKAFLSERQDDWREGLAAAFRHFGGVPRTVLGDNARALVAGRDRATGTVHFHPAYLAFCRDWDVQPRACAPYRARTKGKTEAGVKYVKRNGLADLEFSSFLSRLSGHGAPRGDRRQAADPRHHGSEDRTLPSGEDAGGFRFPVSAVGRSTVGAGARDWPLPQPGGECADFRRARRGQDTPGHRARPRGRRSRPHGLVHQRDRAVGGP